MIPIDQTRMAGQGAGGNCVQACVASMLELAIEDVPHFLEIAPRPDHWELAFDDWLEMRGIISVRMQGHYIFEGFYLATGATARGTRHMCVYRDGYLAHDPHPSKSGLLDVDCTRILVPADIAAFKRPKTEP